MHKFKVFLCVSLLFTTAFLSFAQNNTNSPYTRFGYGELVDPAIGKNVSMGGVSFGSRSKTNINPSNPASYSSIDSLTFLFEFGAGGRISHFSQNDGKSEVNFTGNLDYLALEFPINKWLSSSIGMIPYSFSGYNFTQNDSLSIFGQDEKTYYIQSFSGLGGINQVYWGLSAKFLDHVSIGVNASYLFGYLTNSRSLIFTNSGYSSSNQTSNLTVSDINFRYGIQLFHTFNKTHQVTIGGIFENKSDLNGICKIITTDADTIDLSNGFESPLTYGGGIFYTYKNKLSIGVDFLQQQWAEAKYFGKTDTLNTRTKISFGAEYQHNPNSKNFWEKTIFRLGANYGNSYININNNQTPDFGISFGVGLPLKNSKSIINFGIEYRNTGTSAQNLLREDYIKFSINTTFNELWFFKRKFE